MLKIIDGFGPHTSSLEAMEIYEKHNIILLKEEGDTSHVCQAYDQQVAKDDKRSMRNCLRYLREHNLLTRSVLDGWDLVHVGLAAVRELQPDSWISSFRRVNLHPHYRVGFKEWCVRIAHFLEGGASFKDEDVLDRYSLLPSFWLGMLPSEKERCMQIFNAHNAEFSVPCVKDLMTSMNIAAKDMQSLRLCIEMAVEEPSHIQRLPSCVATMSTTTAAEGATEASSSGGSATASPVEDIAAVAPVVNATRGLVCASSSTQKKLMGLNCLRASRNSSI